MPTDRNTALAAALAPVLGEAAVYAETVYICSNGHINTRCTPNYEWGNECIECDGGAWTDDSIKVPIDFADPAVGWGVLERYLKATSSYLTLDHNTEGSVFEAHVFPDLAYQFVHEGYADTAWGAVIMAWARAMGVGEGEER